MRIYSNAMKRVFDCVTSVVLIILLCAPMLLIAMMVKITSKGPIIYWSDRIGIHNRIFKMPKFRTMYADTPAVATHLLRNPKDFLTPVGSVLRKYSLDEIPQLWSILKGDMSFVGPRPALFNQDDLISLRTEKGIHNIIPGITGWAQINGRDDIPIHQKILLDEYYLKRRSFLFDLKILLMTASKVIKAEGIKH